MYLRIFGTGAGVGVEAGGLGACCPSTLLDFGATQVGPEAISWPFKMLSVLNQE